MADPLTEPAPALGRLLEMTQWVTSAPFAVGDTKTAPPHVPQCQARQPRTMQFDTTTPAPAMWRPPPSRESSVVLLAI